MNKLEVHSAPVNRPDVRHLVLKIAAGIFEVERESINLEMGPDDIDRWDSMNHLRLITEIESVFSVRLSMLQIQQIRSLADLVVFITH